jgi:hypothetical protein
LGCDVEAQRSLDVSASSPANATTAVCLQEAELIAGRYRVEQQLAVGGMGEVLAVLDTSTGRRLALKRLLKTNDAQLTRMFEGEYHALVGLKHPRIIEVLGYGIAGARPYYTMELLDGSDLRNLAPLPYKRACRYLRDIASSLALLHSRRLLHRDVSPRNVRVTSDDRCKLIDFGAMAGFGIMEVVVGTPPYLPPEAVKRVPLDHRADLYALGAVGYWLLTGKHAFPARTIRELPALWTAGTQRPAEALALHEQTVASEEHLPPIPKALDELVMSLLTPDPLGRPASAMEVIDRLNILAELEPEQDVLSARSYLHGAQTVGRGREQGRLRRRLDRCLDGTGASVLIDAVPGMGSTRLISEIALRAQLVGATSVVVDAKLHEGVYGVTNALIDQLLIALPQQSVTAAGVHSAALARFSTLLAARLPPAPEIGPLPQGELRRRIQDALAGWLFAIASHTPLVLAIDNAQQLDEGSAALLATIARGARYHAILLIVARKALVTQAGVAQTDATHPAAIAMRAIEESGAAIELRGLSREEVHELLQGVFGDVPNIGRLAEWLHSLSGGNPQACMDLARHLVESQVIRFGEGVWVLPQELLPGELPGNLEQALDARLSRLSVQARRLAEALCVHRGSLSLERCERIAHAEGIAEPKRALEALMREDVLVQSRLVKDETAYHFGHESVRERIYQSLPDARRAALHLHLGRLLSIQDGRDLNAMLEAGWHLLHGGAEREGADLLAEAGTSLTHGADELAGSVPALRAALEVFRRQKRSTHEQIRVLAPLAIAGFRVDRRLATEYGDEAIAMFRDVIGLNIAARLRPLLGRKLSLYLGLASGVVRALSSHGVKGVAVFRHTVSTFFTCVVSLAGAATICFDIERTKRCVQAIEPLAALGDDHPAGISYRFAKALSRLPEDRVAEVASECRQIIARLNDASRPVKGLPQDSRLLLIGGSWYALGAMECFRDGSYALQCAEQLDAMGLRLYAMAGDQVRTMYHALRGDIARAKQYRERVEMHAIQAGSGWQVEVWSPCGTTLVFTLTRDVIGIKRVAEELDRLVKEIPTLRRHHQLARGVYHELQGDLQVAVEIRQAVLEAAAPRAFIGWPPTVGSHAATLTALGRPAEAKQHLQVVLDHMTEADEPYIAMYQKIFTSLAIADAALGDFDAATTRLDALIEKHGPAEGPLTMGNLHAARVRVALMMNDLSGAQQHLTAMERWLRPSGNPALIGQCERLRRELLRLMDHDALPAAGNANAAGLATMRSELDTLRSVLGQCSENNERWTRALELIVTWAHGMSGYLFMYQPGDDRVRVAASTGSSSDVPLPSQLEDEVLCALHATRDDEDEATSAVAAADVGLLGEHRRERIVLEGVTYRVFVLTTFENQKLRLVGAAAVREGDSPITPPSARLLDAIARSIFEGANG